MIKKLLLLLVIFIGLLGIACIPPDKPREEYNYKAYKYHYLDTITVGECNYIITYYKANISSIVHRSDCTNKIHKTATQ